MHQLRLSCLLQRVFVELLLLFQLCKECDVRVSDLSEPLVVVLERKLLKSHMLFMHYLLDPPCLQCFGLPLHAFLGGYLPPNQPQAPHLLRLSSEHA